MFPVAYGYLVGSCFCLVDMNEGVKVAVALAIPGYWDREPLTQANLIHPASLLIFLLSGPVVWIHDPSIY